MPTPAGWTYRTHEGRARYTHESGAVIFRARRRVHVGWRAQRADGSTVMTPGSVPLIYQWFETSRAAMAAALATPGESA